MTDAKECGHSPRPFAVKQFLLAGLDLEKREESPYCHRAVVTKSLNGLSIVCLGGVSHVKNMVVFEVE